MRQHRTEHDRRKPRTGELLGRDRGEDALDIEIAMDVNHAADPKNRHTGQVERADVIKRAGHQQTRVGVQPERDDVIHALPVKVSVGVHHAFRPVGGA